MARRAWYRSRRAATASDVLAVAGRSLSRRPVWRAPLLRVGPCRRSCCATSKTPPNPSRSSSAKEVRIESVISGIVSSVRSRRVKEPPSDRRRPKVVHSTSRTAPHLHRRCRALAVQNRTGPRRHACIAHCGPVEACALLNSRFRSARVRWPHTLTDDVDARRLTLQIERDVVHRARLSLLLAAVQTALAGHRRDLRRINARLRCEPDQEAVPTPTGLQPTAGPERDVMPSREKHRRSASPPLQKTPTGIQGLDDITRGGLPRGRPTLVSGG